MKLPTAVSIIFLFHQFVPSLTDDSLAGHHLNVAVYHSPPRTFVEHDHYTNQTQIYGPCTERIKWLANKFNFTFTFIPLCVNAVPNEYEMFTQFLERSDLDLLLPQIYVTHMRHQRADYTACTGIFPKRMLLPAPQLENFMWAPVRPFNKIVWILLLVSAILVAVAMSISSSTRPTIRHFSIQLELLHVLAVITGQGEHRTPTSSGWNWNFRLSAGAWCLASVFFYNFYSSTLVSYLTTPQMREYPQSAGGIINDGKLRMLVNKDGLEIEMMNAGDVQARKMRNFFNQHPENIVKNREEAYKKVASGCCAYTDLSLYYVNAVNEDYKRTGKCRFSLGNKFSSNVLMAMALKKRSKFTDQISKGVLNAHEMGLESYWTKMFIREKMPCLSAAKTKPRKRPLNMGDIRFPLVLLILGCVVSFVVFMFERLVYKFRNLDV